MHEASWSRADAIALLDSSERRRHQDPLRMWHRVGLRPGSVVVDVGAGSGFYAFPAARVVGPEGRVYAVDVSEELVDLMREKAAAAKIRNLESVLSSPRHIPLEDAAADMALLANVLHGIPPGTVREAVRVLRPGGRLINVDWKKKPTPEGPPVQHRLSIPEATAALRAYGLTRVDSFDLGPSHYVLVFERPRPARLPGHLISAE
jgi:ubiquinone/menaquinone biosynthesis C-methylase UbiE